MLRAVLARGPSTDQGTFGQLTFGVTCIGTTELPWRDNKSQRSCIPAGKYLCELVTSPKFSKVYHIDRVPGRADCLIHPANLAGDVDLGWTTQLHGCIAPYLKGGYMKNLAGNMQRAGLVSRPALNLLMSWAKGQPFELEII